MRKYLFLCVAMLAALLAGQAAWALSPEVQDAVKLYREVAKDPQRLRATCANFRQLAGQTQGSIDQPAPATKGAAQDDTSSADGWVAGSPESSGPVAASTFFGTAGLIASDPVLAAGFALKEQLSGSPEDAKAFNAAAASLFDKCTM
jgi:hypothetical protein